MNKIVDDFEALLEFDYNFQKKILKKKFESIKTVMTITLIIKYYNLQLPHRK